jgi:hypothetical protein|nr:MAG TPA: hypothetical protein [Caudoviricetes sp.]
MKKLVTLALAGLISTSVLALDAETIIKGEKQNTKSWYTPADVDWQPTNEGAPNFSYQSPWGNVKFHNYPTTLINATWGNEVYPIMVCGVSEIPKYFGDKTPMNVCFGKRKDNTTEIITIVSDEFYREYQAGNIPRYLMTGYHYESDKSLMTFKDACDPYMFEESTTCPTYKKLPKRGYLPK